MAKKPKTLFGFTTMQQLIDQVVATVPYRTPSTVNSFFKYYHITPDSTQEEWDRVYDIIKRKPSIRREILNDICKRTGFSYKTLDKKVYKDHVNVYDQDAVDRWVIKLGTNRVQDKKTGKISDYKVKTPDGMWWQPDALIGEPYIPGKQTEFLQADEDIVFVGGGKGPISLDTKIPTPTGWTTMGEIAVGDQVFNENGVPCNVIGVTPVFVGAECFEVEFSDHSKIKADASHLWWSQDQKQRYANRGIISKRTTKEISGNIKKYRQNNYSVPLAEPLMLPEAKLPIDPWLLGYWLGNGIASKGVLVAGSSVGGEQADADEVLQKVRAAGHEAWIATYKTGGDAKMVVIKGFAKLLAQYKLLDNKHLPPIYLRASQYQRLQVLQGLMDADGGQHRAEVEFDNSNEKLRDDLYELTCSLGMKCWKAKRQGKLYGVNKKMSYRLRILPTMQVFTLKRKAEKLKLTTSQPWLRKLRYIIAVKPIPSVPVRCIVVDSPLHVFLASEAMIPTSNSGKSDLLIMDCIRKEKLSNPKWQGVIFRREYKRLEELISRAKYIFLTKLRPLGARWEDKKNRMVFPSGAWLAFHNCQNLGDEEQYQGWEICDLKFDQIEEFAPSQIDFLMLCNRSGDLSLKSTMRATANPLGRYHSEVKRRFIDGFDESKTYELHTVEDGIRYTKTYRRIQMTVFDNPHLSKDRTYIATLATEPNLIKRKAMLKGDWDVVIGQFFNEFFRDIHVIKTDADFKFPEQWRRIAGLDYGNVKVMEFLTADHLGNIYGEWEYRSEPSALKPSGLTAEEYGYESAKFMLDRGIGENLMVIGDTNMWAATGRDVGTTRLPSQIIQNCWREEFEKLSRKPPVLIPVSKRSSEEYRWRIACNEALRSLLAYKTDEVGKVIQEPRVFWLSRCTSIIEKLPALYGDPNNPMDLADDGQDDHDYDSFKMGLMSILPSKLAKPKKTAQQEWEEQIGQSRATGTSGINYEAPRDWRVNW